jgi:serine/threonine-protein kinase
MQPSAKPDRLGKYEIRAILGRGAMGTVYEGWDAQIERRVAIKTVRLADVEDAEAQEEIARFRRGAQAAGRLSHPNLVAVYDYGEADQLAYIVMELVEGQTLQSVLADGHRMALPEILRLMDQLLAGLAYAHARGVVHRDVKPANVMITRDGVAKLTDFGIARIENSSMTQAGTVLGTPAYMSLEQFTGQVVDQRTDIYAAGIMLYQLLTGERPFTGGMTAIMMKLQTTRPPKPSEISVTAPPGLDAIVDRAIARRPDDRYPTASAFAEALRRFQTAPLPLSPAVAADDDGETRVIPKATTALPVPRPAADKQTPPRKPPQAENSLLLPILAAAAILVLLLAGGGYWFLSSGPGGRHDTTTRDQQAEADARAKRDAEAKAAAEAEARAKADAEAKAAEQAKADADVKARAEAARQAQAAENAAAEAAKAEAAKAEAAKAEADRQAQAAALSAAQIRQRLRDAVAALPCTLLSGDTRDNGAGATISGLSGVGVSRDRLQTAAAAAAPPPVALSWHLKTFENVGFCRGLNTIQRFAARRFGAVRSDFAISLQGGQDRLQTHDLLLVAVRPPEVPASLEIDYLQHDGKVWHMVPSKDAPTSTIVPGAVVVVGTPRPGFTGWEVWEPYGRDMIIATASSNPLFPQPRPDVEDLDTYLEALRDALAGAEKRGDVIFTDALVLDTVERH